MVAALASPHAALARVATTTRFTGNVRVARHAVSRVPRRGGGGGGGGGGGATTTTTTRTRASASKDAPNNTASSSVDEDEAPLPHHLITPVQLFDTEYAREDPKKLTEVKEVIKSWAHDVENGVVNEVTPDTTEAAEWIRQVLTVKIELDDKSLAMLQSKIISDSETLQNLLLMSDFQSVHAMYALQALCHRNGAICMKAVSHGAMDVIRKHANDGEHEQVVCVAMFLLNTIVTFNADTHRLVAKSRIVPVVIECLNEECVKEGCGVQYVDMRGLNVYDYSTMVISTLSHNPAQHNLLQASGCVEVLLNMMAFHGGPVRINAACAVANLVGREEADSRLEEDPNIIEEVIAVLEAALDGKKIGGINYTVWKILQGIANLATLDTNKKRIVKAGALPMLVRSLQESQEEWDKALFWGSTTLWNLAFDDEIKEKINQEPGALDALEEAKRTGSDDTKRKARGAMWMITGGQTDETAHKVSEQDLAKLGGGVGMVENAKGQVMLSYEWRHQQQVLILRDELMERGFTVWMDVDRMRGSTLEAMAAAIEQSDAIIMCVTHRYKESQACRTEAEYAYTRKKPLIPVMFEKNYSPDGWLGIIMGSKLYYNMHNSDEMADAIPGLVGEVEAVGGVSSKPAFMNGGGGGGAGGDAGGSSNLAGSAPPGMMVGPGGASSSPSVDKVSVPKDVDTMTMWLEGRGLGRYKEAFEEQHLYGKALMKLHEEIGYGDPADGKYHDLFTNVLGITSYGHRLLLLAELEELLGPIRWRRQRS